MNSRAVAAKVISQIIVKGHSLSSALPEALTRISDPREKAFIQELCYGVLRRYYELTFLLSPLLEKPLKAKEGDITALLLVGLYQLRYLRVPAHAAVSETVSAARNLKKPWASSLINGILRRYQREAVLSDSSAPFDLPEWLITKLQQAWPEDWEQIAEASNQQAPMTLRVNLQKITRQDYLGHLEKAQIRAVSHPYAEQGIVLSTPRDVQELPGFSQGWVSVQDGASQLVTQLLSEVQSGQRILDACAAPGGKTAAMLETMVGLQCLALDQSEERLNRVRENLARLQLSATIKQGDALNPAAWWDEDPFDWILLDAPCSATGVIRRHPDIKLLRQREDIAALASTQQDLLEALWPLLKAGGQLVYATCSILPAENTAVLAAFLSRHPEAEESPLDAPWGHAQPIGRQIFPGEAHMDGFYYGRLIKKI